MPVCLKCQFLIFSRSLDLSIALNHTRFSLSLPTQLEHRIENFEQPHTMCFYVGSSLPLEVVRTRISVLLVRTEGADVARRIVNQTVPNHLVFPFESIATWPSWAAWLGTEMRSKLGMDVFM